MPIKIMTISIIFSLMLLYSQNVSAELLYDDKIELTTMFEQVESHIFLAMENKQSERPDFAKMHLSHPIENHYDYIEKYFDGNEKYLKKLELVLYVLKNSSTQISNEDFENSLNQISQVIQTGKSLMIADVMDNDVFKLHVIANLLQKSQQEYVDGMNNVGNFRVMEIQTSYGFVVRANSLFSTITLETNDTIDISKKFIKIYQAYGDRSPSSEMKLLQNSLIDNINVITKKMQNKVIGNDLLNDDTSLLAEVNSPALSESLNDQIIPDWIKIAIEFWSEGAISDQEISDTLVYAIHNDLLQFSDGLVKSTQITENFMNFHKGLEQEIENLQMITHNPDVQIFLASSNADFAVNPDIDSVIQKREYDWRLSPIDVDSPFMLSLKNNNLGKILLEELKDEKTRDAFPFDEIHVTNAYGVTVAQTGHNADYIQSDEIWWILAVKDGIYIDHLEYEEHSGLSDAIIAMKIVDHDGNFLGVVKAEIPIKYFLSKLG